ncbi:hypothetical protein [Nocardioides daeguensis]|uniref:Uncharacterized protein n=1 Tax=Nocardioides daeguensis TaxID=908359 RepID=A0ABP6UVR7_9ACTN|nr:hypothetical protein [Nocardioides daeguensis]MBV6726012.1 hypothetical protein [Nocardioides daeguensis]MCR1772472.1 hypothetical protein [Nocardioides daeguensis]
MSAPRPTVGADSFARDHRPPTQPGPPTEPTTPLLRHPEPLDAAVETNDLRQVRCVTALPHTTSGKPQHLKLPQLSESENRA